MDLVDVENGYLSDQFLDCSQPEKALVAPWRWYRPIFRTTELETKAGLLRPHLGNGTMYKFGQTTTLNAITNLLSKSFLSKSKPAQQCGLEARQSLPVGM